MSYDRKSINEIKRPMNSDYLELENADGMPGLVDSTVALDFLIAAKTGIRNLAFALTEIEDSEARAIITSLLNEQIDLHTEISDMMMQKGWFHPYNVKEQFKLDQISAKTSLRIAGLELFPGDTSRLGTFATPNY